MVKTRYLTPVPKSTASRPELSRTEAEILAYILEENLTNHQIAARRGCRRCLVRRYRRRLQEKGLVPLVPTPPQKIGVDPGTSGTSPGTSKPKHIKNDRNLHAFKFRIELIAPIPDHYFRDHCKKCLWIDGHSVQCFKKVILLQAHQGFKIEAASEEKAWQVSMEYWYKVFCKIEHELGLYLVKNRKHNITMTYAEWGTQPSALSEHAARRGEKIYIYNEDGKLRFHCDRSKLYEHEAHGSATGLEDSEAANKHLTDILDHPEAPTLSELSKILRQAIIQNKETAAGLNCLVTLMKKPDQKDQQKLPEYIG